MTTKEPALGVLARTLLTRGLENEEDLRAKWSCLVLHSRSEVLVSHVNARLTVHGRRLLVDRVGRRPPGRPCRRGAGHFPADARTGGCSVSAPRAQPVCRTAPAARRHRRPRTSPSADSRLDARRRGSTRPLRIAAHTGVPARTVARILHRHGVPRLADCDPLTGAADPRRPDHGQPLRTGTARANWSTWTSRSSDGSPTAAAGAPMAARSRSRDAGSATTTSTPPSTTTPASAYAEILPDEKGATAAGFLTRAAGYFAGHGIHRIERVITDNAFAYRNSAAFRQAVTDLGAVQRFIKPHCPWTNGKAERFNRTLQTEWAYRQVFTSNNRPPRRTCALARALQH